MKRVLTFLFVAITGVAAAQTSTANPDTVCYQSTAASIYTVPSVGNGTYTWTITAPGIITSGQGTNTINVDWSAAPPGLIPTGVSVTYTGPAPSFCPSLPVDLDVLILKIDPVITAIGPFCDSDPCVPLNATPAGGTFSGPGVVGNTFCPNQANPGVNDVTYTVDAGGCTFSTTIQVTVNSTPVLGPIQHN